jgi:hypothetical protein
MRACLDIMLTDRCACDAALHDQQCQGDLPEAAAAVEALQGLRQRLPHLRQDPPGAIPLLLPLLQGTPTRRLHHTY